MLDQLIIGFGIIFLAFLVTAGIGTLYDHINNWLKDSNDN